MKNYYFDTSKNLRPFTFATDANEGSTAPTNALRIEPDFKDGLWPCEKNGKWVQVEDHRKETVYSTETGLAVEIKEVGALPGQVTALPIPDEYHTWNGKKWIITPDMQAQKDEDEKQAQATQAKTALTLASEQIEILQDRIELEDYSSNDELATIKESLKSWKKYRIELNKFIAGERSELPAAP